MSVSFDPLGFAVTRSFCWHFEHAAFKNNKEAFKMLPGILRIKKQDLKFPLSFPFWQKIQAYVFLSAIFPSLSKALHS